MVPIKQDLVGKVFLGLDWLDAAELEGPRSRSKNNYFQCTTAAEVSDAKLRRAIINHNIKMTKAEIIICKEQKFMECLKSDMHNC